MAICSLTPFWSISESTDSTLDSLEAGNLSSSYAEILFIGDWGAQDGLKINFTADEGLTTENSIIFYNSPQDYQIHHLDRSGKTLPLGKNLESARCWSAPAPIPS